MPIDDRPFDQRYTDPATTQLPHARYGDPRHNPIAFLPMPFEETWSADSWGEDGHLVHATDNRLRPDDLALPQPPQDPNWRPDADR